MLIHGPYPTLCSKKQLCFGSIIPNHLNNNAQCITKNSTIHLITRVCSYRKLATANWLAAAAAALVIASTSAASAVQGPPEPETLSNIPQMLSGECLEPKDCKKGRIQRPKSRKAESCTTKCVTTCIQGGDGSPGEGPLNFRR